MLADVLLGLAAGLSQAGSGVTVSELTLHFGLGEQEIVVEHRPAGAGRLHLWAEGEADLRLVVEDCEGTILAQDDDSGGGTTPYVVVSVEAGARLCLRIARAGDLASALEPRACLVLVAQDELGRVLAERIEEALGAGAALELAELLESLEGPSGAARRAYLGAPLSELARQVHARGDYAGAARLWGLAVEAWTPALPPTHPESLRMRGNRATSLAQDRDIATAMEVQRALVGLRERIHPPEHRDLLHARARLGAMQYAAGELEEAKAALEQVLSVYARIAEETDPDRLAAEHNLLLVLNRLGEQGEARAAYARLIPALERAHGPDHPDLLRVRLNHGSFLRELGLLEEALLEQERALESAERMLPESHPLRYEARAALGTVLRQLGQLERAEELLAEIVGDLRGLLPEDHPFLLEQEQDWAVTLASLGQFQRARALEERILALLLERLPPDAPEVVTARLNLGTTLGQAGDLGRARELIESAERVLSERHPPEHKSVLRARQNLANVMMRTGDVLGSLRLAEEILAARARSFPSGHPDIDDARLNYAAFLLFSGRNREARTQLEALDRGSGGVWNPEHPHSVAFRNDLAVMLRRTGDVEGARALLEELRAEEARPGARADPAYLAARMSLGEVLYTLGDLEEALAVQQEVLEEVRVRVPAGDPDHLLARLNLACTLRDLGREEEFRPLRRELLALELERVLAAALLSPREALSSLASYPNVLCSVLARLRGDDAEWVRDVFELVETRRALSVGASGAWSRVADDAELVPLVDLVRRRQAELAELAGRDRGSAGDQESLRVKLGHAAAARDRAEAELRRTLGAHSALLAPLASEEYAAALPAGSAAVGFLASTCAGPERAQATMIAHVLRPDGSVVRVDLGERAPLEELALAWRERLGAPLAGSTPRGTAPAAVDEEAAEDERSERELGTLLRERLLDPVLAAAGAAVHRLEVCADDFVHLVPLDALPRDELRVGDGLVITVRIGFAAPRPASGASAGVLLAAGDVDYGARVDGDPLLLAATTPPLADGRRGRTAAAFTELPATADELDAILRLHRESVEAEARVLRGASASKHALRAASPGTRFVHLATHGWFADEDQISILDTGAADGLGMTIGDTIRGFVPMALCGLALAGANQGRDEHGRVPGILTAEELCALDLSACELAVLSACETNVGIRRAGQGIQSLQAALHAAGARTAITSLWKVDDEATRDLMERFYTYLWQDKRPKAEALWRAKQELRAAGRPLRDWAGWVLSGDPE